MTTMRSFTHTPSPVVYAGRGSLDKQLSKGAFAKHQRILLCSDSGMVKTGVVANVQARLGSRLLTTLSSIVVDGDVQQTEACALHAKANNVDAILALGGGSVIDTAKMVGALLATDATVSDIDGLHLVRKRMMRATIPVMAVPTTSGTGAEATQFAVMMDRVAHKKRIVIDAAVVPSAAVLDPELLLTLPVPVACASAVDAVTHAVEALCSSLSNPMGDAWAVESLRMMVGENLLALCLAEPGNVDVRQRMLVAAHLAGAAISTSMLGACHALAHALSTLVQAPHGVCNGVFLLAVMQQNAPACAPAMARIAQAVGGDPVRALDHFIHDVAGVPRTLMALGADATMIDALVERALLDPDIATNPVACDAAMLRGIVERCLS
jgi:alcohol dehydrogenase class IV